jgi:hypothetical protein
MWRNQESNQKLKELIKNNNKYRLIELKEITGPSCIIKTIKDSDRLIQDMIDWYKEKVSKLWILEKIEFK